MTGTNESAPPGRHSGRGDTSNRQGPSWHTQTQNPSNLSRGAQTARRLITQAAEAGQLLSLADLARAAGVTTRTAQLWLRELDAPRSTTSGPSPSSSALPGGPRSTP